MESPRGRTLARELPIFQGWAAADRDRFLASAEFVEKSLGETIIRSSEHVDGLYLILSGRVGVTIPESKAERLLGYLHRGESIGEEGLLSNEPAISTARAMGDCVLLRVPKPAFERFAREIPSFLYALSRTSTARLRRIHTKATTPATARIVSVYSAEPRMGRSLFAFNLAASLARETGRTTLLLEVALEEKSFWRFLRPGAAPRLVSLADAELMAEEARIPGTRHDAGFDFLSVAHEEGASDGERAVSPLLAALSSRYHFIVLDLPPGMDGVLYRILSQSDRVFLLSSTEPLSLDRARALHMKLPAPEKVRAILTPLHRSGRERLAEYEARLGTPVTHTLPETPDLERATAETGVPIVTTDPDAHYSRATRHIARELGGVLVGLALGSGAARGLAHIGVLQVLEEEKILVDIVAGTSIGAFVGAGWAVGYPADKMLSIARAIASKGRFFKISDLAFPPSPALIRPARTEEVLRRVFGERTFSDTLLPLKVLAGDLETSEEVVFERGPIWKAVRASISIPGIFPPYEYEGHTLVDGAILSPIPVSILKRLGVQKIIAVNPIPSSEFVRLHPQRTAPAPREKTPTFNPAKLAWRWAAERLFDLRHGELPGIMDVIVKSNQYLAAEVAEVACRDASVVIRPWVPDLSWLDFDNPDPFVEAGRVAARASLPQLRALTASHLEDLSDPATHGGSR